MVSFAESATLGVTTAPWRLSIADLGRPGPFSILPGHRRVLVPVDSAITLEVDGALHHVPRHEPLTFAGAARTVLVGLARPGRAVNLMVAIGELEAGASGPTLTPCASPHQGPLDSTLALALTAGRGTDQLDLWEIGPDLGMLGVRRWLIVG